MEPRHEQDRQDEAPGAPATYRHTDDARDGPHGQMKGARSAGAGPACSMLHSSSTTATEFVRTSVVAWRRSHAARGHPATVRPHGPTGLCRTTGYATFQAIPGLGSTFEGLRLAIDRVSGVEMMLDPA